MQILLNIFLQCKKENLLLGLKLLEECQVLDDPFFKELYDSASNYCNKVD